MIDAALLESLLRARAAVTNWMDGLPEAQRVAFATSTAAASLIRLSYVDGYLRIKRTVPLILRAIERLDGLDRKAEAAFWIDHLKEEAFHDEVMRADLVRLLGGEQETAAALGRARITPPSAALLGYFEWQVALGDPALLIAMRLFLEWYVAELEDWRVADVNALVEGGSRIMLTHKELDQDHVRPCTGYIAEHCRGCLPELLWSIEFAGRCLGEAHLFSAQGLAESGERRAA